MIITNELLRKIGVNLLPAKRVDKKHTIKEIARMAGVSAAAVSYVINGKKGVSDETRKKVEEIIKSTDFIPNPNSRRLFYKKTYNIGLIIEKNSTTLDSFFHLEITREIVHVCEGRGYNLIISSTEVADSNVEVPKIIKTSDVDGIIFLCDIKPSMLAELQKYSIPKVFVDTSVPVKEYANVMADYGEAAYTATKHLVEKGHTMICYLGDNRFPNFTINTFNGFKKAVEEFDISIPINWVFFKSSNIADMSEFVGKVMTCRKVPTAFFCAADIYAVNAMNVLAEKNYRVPDDVSIIGIDDILLSSYIMPPLTTVSVGKNEMGVAAFDMLMKMIESGTQAADNVYMPIRLIERKTVMQISK